MKTYSVDLRRKILATCDRGENTKFVAGRFWVSPAWVLGIKQQRREHGELGPRRSGGNRRGEFGEAALEQLRKQVDARPDMTLEQLWTWVGNELGIDCSVMAGCRALRRAGLTFK